MECSASSEVWRTEACKNSHAHIRAHTHTNTLCFHQSSLHQICPSPFNHVSYSSFAWPLHPACRHFISRHLLASNLIFLQLKYPAALLAFCNPKAGNKPGSSSNHGQPQPQTESVPLYYMSASLLFIFFFFLSGEEIMPQASKGCSSSGIGGRAMRESMVRGRRGKALNFSSLKPQVFL